MPHFNVKIRNEIKTKVRLGVPIRIIASELNINLSSVYYYYKQIKGKKYQEPNYKMELSEIEGEIVGIFAGDGSQSYYKKKSVYETNISIGSVHYLDYVKKLFESYFQKSWLVTKRKDKELWMLRAFNKKTFDYFNEYLYYDNSHKHDTVFLKNKQWPKQFIIGFLRGLLDTDGYISFNRNYPIAAYTTTSERLAEQIQALLNSLGILTRYHCYKRIDKKDLHYVIIRGKSTTLFLMIIQPYKAKSKGLLRNEQKPFITPFLENSDVSVA